MEDASKKTFLESFVLGSVSGTISSTLLQPLDMVKTRQQTVTRLSIVQHTRLIYRHEGILAFWKGLVPTLARTVPGVGVYFSSLQTLQKYCIGERKPSSMEALLLGCTARSMAGVLLIPVTVIKTRYESGLFSYTGLLNALSQIHRKEGLRGLTSGIFPTLLRDAPFSGIYLMFYTKLKTASQKLFGHHHHDRHQAHHDHHHLAKETDRIEPHKSISQNDTSQAQHHNDLRQTKDGNATKKNQVRQTSEQQQDDDATPPNAAVSFVCGICAGALACLVTHPFDVLKTKVQISRSETKLEAVISEIMKNQGVGGFFTGLTPRLLRRTLMTALSWTLFERFSLYLRFSK